MIINEITKVITSNKIKAFIEIQNFGFWTSSKLSFSSGTRDSLFFFFLKIMKNDTWDFFNYLLSKKLFTPISYLYFNKM